MKSLKMTAIAVALTVLPGIALAQSGTTSTPRIDERQAQQDKRIDQGVASGALNQREAARLEKGQRRVQRMEDKAAADGKVTAKERHRIEHAQDRQSRQIYREKHDKRAAK